MAGNSAECPGIGIKHRDDRTISMTQKGLIEKIIATAKMKRNANQTRLLH